MDGHVQQHPTGRLDVRLGRRRRVAVRNPDHQRLADLAGLNRLIGAAEVPVEATVEADLQADARLSHRGQRALDLLPQTGRWASRSRCPCRTQPRG